MYLKADRSYTGGVTVPVLWDRDRDTIVDNEAAEITRMLDVAFVDFGRDLILYPGGYRDEIDRVIEALYPPVNNGVYRAGFAESRAAYEHAVGDLFEASTTGRPASTNNGTSVAKC